jgi:endonuclease/exonuclease/phosphatase family metal-dependent hydrolase
MLTLLSLNLRFGLAGDTGERSWDRRKAALPPLFARVNPDFLCFQEVNDFQARELAAMLPEYGAIGRRTPAPRFWQNNLIFFKKRWTCLAADRFFLSPTPDVPSRFRDSRWPRQCTLGRFCREGSEVVCGSTHFDFRSGVQLRSAQVLLARLNRFAGQTSRQGSGASGGSSERSAGAQPPAILAGDFNAAPHSPAFRHFRREGGFQPALSPPFPTTYHGFSGKPGGPHIDWILFRGKLEIAEAGVRQEAFADGAGNPLPPPSDHFPVTAAFRRL